MKPFSTSKHASEYDLSGTTHRRRDDFGDAGHRMSVGEIHEMLKPEAKKQPKLAELQKEASAADEGQDKKRRNYISARIESDFVMVDTLDRLVGKALKTTGTEPVEAPASAHHRPLPGGDGPSAPTQKKTADNKKTPRKHPNVYTRNYRQRHSAWRNELDRQRKETGVYPTDEQWQLLDDVHARCVFEYQEECDDTINAADRDPARFFVHGLPGSGKTETMKWLATYFETVWNWASDRHFVFLAPFNTMAARIDGHTAHSWGEIQWKADGPNGGIALGGRKTKNDMSSMAAKLESLRFVLIDEIEATGAELQGELQEHMAEAAPRKNSYKYRRGQEEVRPRPFGGVNVIAFGDLWQLAPPQQTNICSNPDKPPSTQNHFAADMMTMYWRPTRERGFNGRSPYEFRSSKRLDDEREDAQWFNMLIDECREGRMSDTNYNFFTRLPDRHLWILVVRRHSSVRRGSMSAAPAQQSTSRRGSPGAPRSYSGRGVRAMQEVPRRAQACFGRDDHRSPAAPGDGAFDHAIQPPALLRGPATRNPLREATQDAAVMGPMRRFSRCGRPAYFPW